MILFFVVDQCEYFRFAIFRDGAVLSEQSAHCTRTSKQVSIHFDTQLFLTLSCGPVDSFNS